MICARCGRELTPDEVGLSRKLINRGTTMFFCLTCLSRDFRLPEADLVDMIARFREAGCMLFT